MSSSYKALNLAQFENLLHEGAIVIDFRDAKEFIKEYIPGSIYGNEAFLGSSAAKSILPSDIKVLVVADKKAEQEVHDKLIKLGLTNVAGYLEGGFQTWLQSGNEIDVAVSIEADEIVMDLKFSDPEIIDIRGKVAYDLLHLQAAQNIAGSKLIANIKELPDNKTYYIYCEDGERSLSLISYLKRSGLHNFYHITGGFQALHQADAPMQTNTVTKPQDLN
jgi:rhodanese-related sulfurtransferase